MTAHRPRRPLPAPGFTLVELMVALALSMILAAALLKMQATLGIQRVRTSDISARDNEARAAMDLMTQDLSGSGFLFAGSEKPCNALFTYDSAITGGYFVHHPVDAVAAANASVMTFGTGLTLNYPPAGSTLASDVLVITGSSDASAFNNSTNPLVAVSVDPAYQPTTLGVLPLVAGAAPTAGHVAIVEAPNSDKTACMRVPLTLNVPGTNAWQSNGTFMPASKYTGFANQMVAAGFTDAMADGELFQAKLIDVGLPTSTTQTTTAFYVDNNAGSFPVLMRATYRLLDDAPIGTPQQIAAGVVSLQVRFGMDPGNTGAVTQYDTAATVTTNKTWDFVRSVRVAIVTRSINNDPDASYVWPSTTVGLGTPFTDVAVAANTSRRFVVQQTELAVRNQLWLR